MKVDVEYEQECSEEKGRKNGPRHIIIPIESKPEKIEAAYDGRSVRLRTKYVKGRTHKRPKFYDAIVELTPDEIRGIVSSACRAGMAVIDENAVKEAMGLLESASAQLEIASVRLKNLLPDSCRQAAEAKITAKARRGVHGRKK
jgi:hypothetical protein